VASPSSLIRSLLLLCVAASAAHAERKLSEPTAHPPLPSYIRVPGAAANRSGTSAVSSNIVYLRRCPVGAGCFVKEGNDDSRTDTSSIVVGQRIIGEFSQGDQVWADTVACVKETMAPFNIVVTDVDPGTTPHFENVVGGKSSDLGRSDLTNAGGVAPFDCSEIPNAIVYTFDVYGPDAQALCWTCSQEVAHAFGLDHEFLQKDPMTYVSGDLPKRFRDQDADCGEFESRACSCATGGKQNSYRTIVGLFGPGAPTPPVITVQRPTDGKQVQPGFRMSVKALDDVRVDKVELFIDGTLGAMSMTEVGDVFDLSAPADLPMGSHSLEVRATDVQGIPASAMLTVDEGAPCTASKGCSGTDVCVMGICLPGPGEPGGLGAVCQMSTECLSHVCQDAGEQFKHCTEVCDPANAGSCPNGFDCIPNGAAGACWPAPDGGCCDAGTAPQGSILLGVGIGALVLRRRRRR